eukprot:1795448-Alexandrium_andersonii.AAC.1
MRSSRFKLLPTASRDMARVPRSLDVPFRTPRPTPASTSSAPKRQLDGSRGGSRAVSYTHLTLPTICSV